jgi:hypothetical protein
MLKKTKTWLLRQPLLLPFAGLTLAILSIDSGAYIAWCSLVAIGIVAAFTSRKLVILTLTAAFAGGFLHYFQLQSQREAKLLNNQKVEIYGIIDSPPRITIDRPTEAIL